MSDKLFTLLDYAAREIPPLPPLEKTDWAAVFAQNPSAKLVRYEPVYPNALSRLLAETDNG